MQHRRRLLRSMAVAAAGGVPGCNGVMTLPRRWCGLLPSGTLYGGPFRHAPADMAGLCLLETPPKANPLHRHMPIKDFSVPADVGAVNAALRAVFTPMLRGQPVYIGCAGGWGRTGLMMALIAKAAGADAPVAFVRAHYTPRAVETVEQQRYVDDFAIEPLRRWLFWTALRHRCRSSSGRPLSL